jgi:chromosome segregation and condensation protein ScpB
MQTQPEILKIKKLRTLLLVAINQPATATGAQDRTFVESNAWLACI